MKWIVFSRSVPHFLLIHSSHLPSLLHIAGTHRNVVQVGQLCRKHTEALEGGVVAELHTIIVEGGSPALQITFKWKCKLDMPIKGSLERQLGA